MLSKRDGISYEEELAAIRDVAIDMEHAFYNGNLNEAEDILREELSLEPDYLDLFIF
jgi:prophage maintenance system killer protein